MSFDVTTLALAKSYADQHGGGGGGASTAGDFIIKMTVEADDDGDFTVASCDTTVEQIDEAVAAEKRVVLNVSFDGTIIELPMVQGNQGNSYYFCAFLFESVLLSSVYKIENTSSWAFSMHLIGAGTVSYSNSTLPNISTVSEALDKLVPNSHTHANKAVLDKFAETDGKPTYNGEALGGGAGDFIIKMAVTSDDNDKYIVTSCDATVEQIDAAVADEKRVVVIATDTANGIFFELPMLQGVQDNFYYFGMFLAGQVIVSFVQKVSENEATWQFLMTEIEAGAVSYSNDALPNMPTVQEAIDALVTKSHTHSNKDTLDKLSDSNGKLQYNGSDILIKSDKQEIVNDVLAALPTWTGGNY